jgi:hypothetical protein
MVRGRPYPNCERPPPNPLACLPKLLRPAGTRLIAVWLRPLRLARSAEPPTTPHEPLSEDELRGLSACRFLLRFFRSHTVHSLAAGDEVLGSHDRAVRLPRARPSSAPLALCLVS